MASEFSWFYPPPFFLYQVLVRELIIWYQSIRFCSCWPSETREGVYTRVFSEELFWENTMDEENVHRVPRGLTLEQAQFLGLQRGQEELSA